MTKQKFRSLEDATIEVLKNHLDDRIPVCVVASLIYQEYPTESMRVIGKGELKNKSKCIEYLTEELLRIKFSIARNCEQFSYPLTVTRNNEIKHYFRLSSGTTILPMYYSPWAPWGVVFVRY